MTDRLAVDAVCYRVAGKIIPARLTVLERVTFARGAGLPPHQAAVMGMQDRASSLANVLGVLIAKSGDPELIRSAERLISKWNDECGDFLNMQ